MHATSRAPVVDVAALTRFACRTRGTDVPERVWQDVRLLMLDTLGSLVGALRYPPVQALAELLRSREPAGPADTPFGRLVVLGTAATWLDADSGGSFHPQGHRLPPVPTAHPAPHSLPVLLHGAAAGGFPDQRLLEVFLLANEVGMRLGTGTSLRPGLHPHGIHGPVAAGIAAALLRGLDEEATARALVLSGSMPLAATLAVPMGGGTIRNVWTGLGAYYGAAAAGRAADGAPAAPALLTELLTRVVCTDPDPEELSGALGCRWRISDSYLKPYACARWIHPALDAWRIASGGRPIDPGMVEAIDVDTFAFAASLTATEPSSDLHARFSLPVCVATLALDGELVAASFLPERLARPEVAALAARVQVRESPELSAALPRERPARVRARWSDGRVSSGAVRQARGNPGTRLAPAEVVTKFRRNVDGVLPELLAEGVVAALAADGECRGASLAAVGGEVLGRLTP